MKQCPYCGEMIEDLARKCCYCAMWVDREPNMVTGNFATNQSQPAEQNQPIVGVYSHPVNNVVYWYMFIGDSRLGPFLQSDLVANGLTAQTFVWREGMTDWQYANTVPELLSLLAQTAFNNTNHPANNVFVEETKQEDDQQPLEGTPQLETEQPTAAQELSFYMYINNNEVGPFAVSEMLSRGLTPSVQVWREGMAEWMPARDVPELQPILPEGDETTGGEVVLTKRQKICRFIGYALYLIAFLDFALGNLHIFYITPYFFSPVIFGLLGYLIIRQFGGGESDDD